MARYRSSRYRGSLFGTVFDVMQWLFECWVTHHAEERTLDGARLVLSDALAGTLDGPRLERFLTPGSEHDLKFLDVRRRFHALLQDPACCDWGEETGHERLPLTDQGRARTRELLDELGGPPA